MLFQNLWHTILMSIMNSPFFRTSVAEALLLAGERYAYNTALEINDDSYSYQQLFNRAQVLADLLREEQSAYLGLVCERGLLAYLGVLASVFSGKAYVPFDLSLSGEQLVKLINELGCECVLIDAKGKKLLEPYLDSLAHCTMIDCGVEALDKILPSINITKAQVDDVLYVLFTSGSTGKPKAVPITHGNLLAYLREMNGLYPLNAQDRCTQAFELTFDPSVHDMFFTWLSGATLCFMNERARLGAHTFIQKHGITVWNTIPSLLKMLLPLKGFSSEKLSTLRRVMLNGEALSRSVAQRLQAKIPDAQLIGFYGLTETTVNMAHCIYSDSDSHENHHALVPIGKFFDSIDLHMAENDELLVAGQQIFKGYLGNDIEVAHKNARLFVQHQGLRYLRTGDVLKQDESGIWHYQERIDDQVKLQGHRVDLFELQLQLERISGEATSLVLMYEDEQGIQRLAGFVQNALMANDVRQEILNRVNQSLPVHAQLENVYCLESYPYRSSGKIDKQKLRQQLRSGF